MSHFISTPTSQLAQGDIVCAHGMVLFIDRPVEEATGHHLPGVYRTQARVLNPDEVREAKVVPFHWLTDHTVDSHPRWTIQGNDLATWAVEAHPNGWGCHFKLDPGSTHGAFACGERR